MSDINDKILDWFCTGEVGASSEAIAKVMIGKHGPSRPHDPADFCRCLKLIRAVPEIRPRLHEMENVSGEWAKLIDRWDELEACFMAEVPGWLDDRDCEKSAPKTYALMQEIFK
jgi:hypothetical protein